jgi:hypothetical protein
MENHMDHPLELTFHNMKPSTELEALVREQASKLEQLHHIVRCRVTVGLPGHAHQSGNVPEIHVEIHLAGRDITVNHKHDQGGGAQRAVRDAFGAAKEQLKEFKARRAQS